MTPPLAGVPIKPFGIAKARLAPALDAGARSRLGRAIAAHTLRTVADLEVAVGRPEGAWLRRYAAPEQVARGEPRAASLAP